MHFTLALVLLEVEGMKREPRTRKARPLMIFAVGVAALSLGGCDDNDYIGNPKEPPDLSGEVGPDIGNPKEPPDMKGVD